jgi:hypothetical protein
MLVTLPSSPLETRISTPNTSPSAKVTVSMPCRCVSLGFKMILFLPSITFFLCSQESIPNNNDHGDESILTSTKERRQTFNWLATPIRGHLCHRLRNCPVLLANLEQSHSGFSGGPRSLQYIGSSSSNGILFRCADDQCLSAN